MKRWWWLVFPGIAHGGGFALSGTGVVPQGMAGAASAWISDHSAIFWNPAGLAAAPREVALSGLGIRPVISYEPKTGLYYYDGGFAWRTRVANKQGWIPVPSGGVTFPVENKDLAVGLALFVPFGLGGSFDLFDLPLGYYAYDSSYTPQDAPTYPKYDWESDLQDVVVALGAAKAFGQVQAGLAIGGAHTKIYLRRPVAVFTGETELPVQYSHFFVDQKMEASGYHAFFTAGLRYQPVKNLSLGASVRGGTNPDLSGKVDLTLYLPYNRYIASQLAQDPSRAADSVLFLGGTRHSTADVKATLPLPWTYTAGVAWRPVPNVLVAYDLSYTTWGDLQTVTAKLDGNDPLGQPLEDENLAFFWKSTLRHSVGVMYSLETVSFRGGVYYDPTPIPHSTLTPLIPDIGAKWGLNLGFSYQATPRIRIDGHYEFLYVPELDFTGLEDPDEDLTADNMPGKYSMDLQALELGLAYTF